MDGFGILAGKTMLGVHPPAPSAPHFKAHRTRDTLLVTNTMVAESSEMEHPWATDLPLRSSATREAKL